MSNRLRNQELTTRPRVTITGTRLPYAGLLYKVEAINVLDGGKLSKEGNLPECLYWGTVWARRNETFESLKVAA
ncbi:hypothetical protein [Arthrobacter sp. StoSoilB13]|uniref:hypothetical protein n=1 Tax=Arthrobacter sp. StoSoilB13 TaxID=2830993 RepID=UPI001CC57766|nr:hypothetical protein [Arthrobacter sp. StoSoilB13]BCW47945.1 hypothetical protein StoSoilB13_02870 [Arthrobacter sp. StoSoilB13]